MSRPLHLGPNSQRNVPTTILVLAGVTTWEAAERVPSSLADRGPVAGLVDRVGLLRRPSALQQLGVFDLRMRGVGELAELPRVSKRRGSAVLSAVLAGRARPSGSKLPVSALLAFSQAFSCRQGESREAGWPADRRSAFEVRVAHSS